MLRACALILLLLISPSLDAATWHQKATQAIQHAGDNAKELTRALNSAPKEQQEALAFLIANMPQRDLRSLSAKFLLDHTALAYQARKQFAWARSIPKDIFFNDILPYANVDEKRSSWRKMLYDICAPLVKDCRSASEAAHRLNSTIFKKLKVRYSTRRRRANQCPEESIEQGLASCTGLSILLSNACRSVGIPARLVGAPLWVNKRGNHTWVEIWDQRWHFTGAAEPSSKGLNHGWFVGIASKAQEDSRLHAIYAVSFKKSKTTFPLVWAPRNREVFAVNVTARYAKKASAKKLDAKQKARIETSALEFFNSNSEKQEEWDFDESLDQWTADHEAVVRNLVWKAYQRSSHALEQKQDFEKDRVRSGKTVSPYFVKTVGKRPEKGWPLFIAMHGGGATAKQFNDRQWDIMKRYYRDQKSVTGYRYLALRAPNDLWNGFYAPYVPPLILRLIRQFLVFGDVDPNKVYLMGYSHGGYGAFYIGPKIPHRFAAIHSSAAAPTDGTISAKCLRNTRFTFMIGGRDVAYGRLRRCQAFSKIVEELKKANKGHYPVEMELKKSHGHGGLPDRDKILEMYAYVRNPVPKHVTWETTDNVVGHHFWLTLPDPAHSKLIDAVVKDNTITMTTKNVKTVELGLDRRLVDLDKPVTLILNGKNQTVKVRARMKDLCASMLRRGDPKLAFTSRLSVTVP